MQTNDLATSPYRSVQADPRDLPGILASTQRSVSAFAAPEPTRVLVVHRHEPVRSEMAAVLEHHGYDVVCAQSDPEATERLRTGACDVILYDAQMSGGSSVDPLSELMARNPELVLILVTESIVAETGRNVWLDSAVERVASGCTAGELVLTLQHVLTRRTLQRRNVQRYRIAAEASGETVLDALLTALNARDTEMQGHSERVTAYTMELGDRMGVTAEQMYHIERGALLHDIGKIGIPDRILHKPGSLSPEEWIEMRKHPIIGHKMCVKVEMLQEAAEIVLRHHEKWDGTGYPDGIRGADIPLGARIFAVADALDAITSDRPYHKAASFTEARAEIAGHAGSQFDPAVVKVYLSVPDERWSFIRAHAAR